MSTSEENKAQVLFDNDHTCCICHDKNKGVQTHHIDGNDKNDDPQNIAILCLDDHSYATGSHGFEKKYGQKEIRKYKTDWEDTVNRRRLLEKNQQIPIFLVDLKEKSIEKVELSKGDISSAQTKVDFLYKSLEIIKPFYPSVAGEIESIVAKDRENIVAMNPIVSGTLASQTASTFIEEVSGKYHEYPEALNIPSESIRARIGFQPHLQYFDITPINNFYWARTIYLPYRIPLCPSCLSQNQYSLLSREDRWADETPRRDGFVAFRCQTCKGYWTLTLKQEEEGKNYRL